MNDNSVNVWAKTKIDFPELTTFTICTWVKFTYEVYIFNFSWYFSVFILASECKKILKIKNKEIFISFLQRIFNQLWSYCVELSSNDGDTDLVCSSLCKLKNI